MDEKNRLFEEFDTKKLEELTADNLDSFRDQVFIEDVNRDLVNDLIRFGIISGQISLSGPMPRTSIIATSEVTYTTESTVTQELFKPGAGEVWVYNQASVRMQGGTSGITLHLGADEVTTTNNIMLGQESSSGIQPFDLVGQQSPIYVTRENYLIATHYSLGTGETSTVKCCLVRVR